MNADRLIRMGLKMLMRFGLRRMARGQKPTDEARQAKAAVRSVKRMRRM